MIRDVQRLTPPAAAGVLEPPDKFLFLGSDAKHRQSLAQPTPPLSLQMTELVVALRFMRSRQALAIGPQRVAILAQQACDAGVAHHLGVCDAPERAVPPV